MTEARHSAQDASHAIFTDAAHAQRAAAWIVIVMEEARVEGLGPPGDRRRIE